MGFSVLLIKAFEVFKINEPASAGFYQPPMARRNRPDAHVRDHPPKAEVSVSRPLPARSRLLMPSSPWGSANQGPPGI